MDFDEDTFYTSGTVLPKVLRDKCRLQTQGHTAASAPPRRSPMETQLPQTSRAILSVQKQVIRGEEIYLEEATHNCHLFRGWETMMDVRLDYVTAQKRITPEQQWFSRKSSIGRHVRSFAIGTRVRADTRPITKYKRKKADVEEKTSSADAELQNDGSKAEGRPTKRQKTIVSDRKGGEEKDDDKKDKATTEASADDDAPRRGKRRSGRKR